MTAYLGSAMRARVRHGAAVVIALLALAIPVLAAAQPTISDSFDGSEVARQTWRDLEFIRQVASGQLESTIRAFGAAQSNPMDFSDQTVNPAGVMSIQADVTVNAASAFGPPGFPPSRASAQVVAALYNDGSGGGGQKGTSPPSCRSGTTALSCLICTSARMRTALQAWTSPQATRGSGRSPSGPLTLSLSGGTA